MKKAVERWTPDDQDRLATLLTVLRLQRDPACLSELDRRLQDTDPANWMTLSELKDRLKEQ